MQPQRLFIYDNYAEAVVVTGYEETENMPLSNTKVKVYKGSPQRIKFGIFDSDGKPWITDPTIIDTNLYVNIIDTRYNKLVVSKELNILINPQPLSIQGRSKQTVKRPITYFECILTIGDTQDLDPGCHYSYTVFQTDGNNIQTTYLYTDIGYTVPGEFEILDTASVQFTPSVNTGPNADWIKVTPGIGNGYWNFDSNIVGTRDEAISNGWVLYSSTVYPASLIIGSNSIQHTAACYPNKLSGVLRISGTLAGDAPQLDENQWFPIPDDDGVLYHSFSNESETRDINFTGNLTWIRYDLYVREYGDPIPVPPSDFVDQGSIDKILFRI